MGVSMKHHKLRLYSTTRNTITSSRHASSTGGPFVRSHPQVFNQPTAQGESAWNQVGTHCGQPHLAIIITPVVSHLLHSLLQTILCVLGILRSCSLEYRRVCYCAPSRHSNRDRKVQRRLQKWADQNLWQSPERGSLQRKTRADLALTLAQRGRPLEDLEEGPQSLMEELRSLPPLAHPPPCEVEHLASCSHICSSSS